MEARKSHVLPVKLRLLYTVQLYLHSSGSAHMQPSAYVLLCMCYCFQPDLKRWKLKANDIT